MEEGDDEDEAPEEEPEEQEIMEENVLPETSEDLQISIFVSGGSSSYENSSVMKSILDSPAESPLTSIVILTKEKSEQEEGEEEHATEESAAVDDEEDNNENEEQGESDPKAIDPPVEKKEVIDFVKLVKEKEEYLQAKKIKFIEVSFTNIWEGVLSVRKQVDPFLVEAAAASIELPKEDTDPFEREHVLLEQEEKTEEQEGGDDPQDDEETSKKEIRHEILGLSGIFCPVTLKNRRLLVKGDSSLCVSYKGKHYVFDTQEAMDEFILRPHIYTSEIRNTTSNIWMIGVDEQSSYSTKISETFSLPIVKLDLDFLEKIGSEIDTVIEYIKELEKPIEHPKKEKSDDEEEEEEEAPEEEDDETAKEEKRLRRLCNILKLVLKDQKYVNGYILTSIPLGEVTEPILNILDELEVFPTLLINFKVNEEQYVKKNFDKNFSQYKQHLLQKKIDKRKKKEQAKIDVRLKKKKEDDDNEETQQEEEEEEPVKTKDEILEDVQKSYSDAFEKTEEIANRYLGKRFVVRDFDSAKPERVVMRQVLDFIYLMKDKKQIFDFITTCDHDTAIKLVFEGRKKLGFGYFDKVDKLQQTSQYPKMEGNFLTICQDEDPFQYVEPPKQEEVAPQQPEEKSNNEENQDEEQTDEEKQDDDEQNEEEKNEEEGDEQEEKDGDEENEDVSVKKTVKPPKPEISFPVVVNNLVFFFKTEKNREIFLKERTRLIETEIDQKEFRPKILLYGGDPEKREILARKVAAKLGCTYVSCLEIVQTFMKYQTAIGNQFRSEENPFPEGDDLLSYLKRRLNHFDCVVNGFIIDGIFPTYEDIKEFAKKGDIIDKVFFLDNRE